MEIGSAVEEPEKAVRIQIYRIVQEALTNVALHGCARRVHVKLVGSGSAGGGLTLEIDDDGAGFDPQRVHAGLGLQGMRERAQSMGSCLRLDSKPGRGTCIRVLIPRSADNVVSNSALTGALMP